MDASLLHQNHRRGLIWLILGNNWLQAIPLQLWHGWDQEPLQSGLHFHVIYIKCICTFWCSGWSYGCILTSSKPWRWTALAKSGSQLGTKHTTTTTTWLWPRTTTDWITLLSYMYIKYLSIFQCSRWSSLLTKTMEVGWAGWI